MEQAHIVFSPYNYLIDPRVRRSMNIPLKDNVIILDEAHNIEDAARESAGGTWTHEDFRLALLDCEKVFFCLLSNSFTVFQSKNIHNSVSLSKFP